ncbi:carbohydrate porin [Sphingomonas glacialis]|uniref:carbohydrate porin n=1 Tax=Sphingomonas glacialis TaxID=658225 RepID=UPI00138720F2|nr:carbohydrate porin [Sphingomonas glacialis]
MRIAIAGLVFGAMGEAGAQTTQLAPTPAQTRGENGEALRRPEATVTLALTYTSDLNGDVSGGDRRGAAYLQRVGVIADADLDRLVGWRGASAHLSVHSIVGEGLSAHRVGNVLTVSGIEAEPALRLFNLWIEQKVGRGATLRVGQFTAGQEFAISPTANLFVNATFGWPGSFATDLPSGGPAYPLAAPGIRVALEPGARTKLRLAVFAGDPAGPGGGDPQRRDLHGLNGWRLAGKPFVIGEIARTASGADPAWSIVLGSWVHFDRFQDLRYDVAGRSLAGQGANDPALQHAGNAAVYAILDLKLLQSNGRTLHGFLRGSASPQDRNAIDLYADGGLSLTQPFKGRPNDVVGIGAAVARLSPRLRGLVKDQSALSGQPVFTPAVEAVFEITYQAQVRRGLSVQPNVQLVLHPSAAVIADPQQLSAAPSNAVVVGVRTAFRL